MEKDIYFLMYQEVWKFHKKFFENVPDPKDDGAWEQIINEANAICEKYKRLGYKNFIVGLLSGEITELEKISRLQKQQKVG